MNLINDEISNPFVIIQVGNYGYESLSGIMDRILREIEYERLSNPRPWYPFAYSKTPPDESVRYNLKSWKDEYGSLPEKLDLLFCANACGLEVWPSFENIKYSRENLVNDNELIRNKIESWKKMIPSVKGNDCMPDHYLVCNDDESVGYYALIIEDLKLIEYEEMRPLDLTRCKTFPNGARIPTRFQGLVCTKSTKRIDTTYKEAWVIGKANLIDPFAVRLVPPEEN